MYLYIDSNICIEKTRTAWNPKVPHIGHTDCSLIKKRKHKRYFVILCIKILTIKLLLILS